MNKKNKPDEMKKKELIQCQYCGGLVAPDAPRCVHCGTRNPYKIQEEPLEKAPESVLLAKIVSCIVVFLFVILLLGILLFPACR